MALRNIAFRMRVDERAGIAVGAPIQRRALQKHRDDPKSMMDFLRAETYSLSPRPFKSIAYGFEFEDKYRA